jgi:hypothetical protein
MVSNKVSAMADPKKTRSGWHPKVSNTLENDTTAAASETGSIKRGRPPIFTGHHTLIGNKQTLIQASYPVAGSSVSVPDDQIQLEDDASVPKEDLSVPAQTTPEMVEAIRKEREQNRHLKKKLQESEDEFYKFKEGRNSRISGLENRLEKLLGEVNFIIIYFSLAS